MSQLSLGVRPDEARFSDCGRYRYTLTRELGGDTTLIAIGLNPSTATEIKNDQTIAKDVGFARRWGFGRVLKLNAYAFRARDPKEMARFEVNGFDIVGTDNDRTIAEALSADHLKLLVGWGTNISGQRQRQLADLFERVQAVPWCLGVNKDGSPEHELYIPYDRPLRRWVCP